MQNQIKVRSPANPHLALAGAAVEAKRRCLSKKRAQTETAPVVTADAPTGALADLRFSGRLLPAAAAHVRRHPSEVSLLSFMEDLALARRIRAYLTDFNASSLEQELEGVVDLDEREVHRHGRLLTFALLLGNHEGAAILIRHGASINLVTQAYPSSIAETVLDVRFSDATARFLAEHQASALWELFAKPYGPVLRGWLPWTPGNHARWPPETRRRIFCLLVCLKRRVPRTVAYYLSAFVATTPD